MSLESGSLPVNTQLLTEAELKGAEEENAHSSTVTRKHVSSLSGGGAQGGAGGWVSHDVTAAPHPSPPMRRPPGERGSEKG